MGKSNATRCDLHLHSTASRNTDEWYSRSFDCPESYADPIAQYELCKARGMTLVTLTDHDTIDGGLKLLDRPDFFLSEEVTTYFPENNCTIHVLAWNITPAQHDEIQALRANVYDLVDMLRRDRIAYGCAHPLVSTNWKLDVDTLEKIMVMFPVLEGINGLTDRRIQGDLDNLVAGMNRPALERLARRHDLALADTPYGARSAGSDDHSQIICGSCWTEVDGHAGAGDLLEAVMAGQARPCGKQADLNTMHMTVSRTTYHFLGDRRNERPDYRDPFVDLIDVLAGREKGEGPSTGSRDDFVKSLVSGAARSVQTLSPALDALTVRDPDDAHNGRVIAGIARIHDGLVEQALEELINGVGDLDMYRVLGGLRDLAGAVTTVVPYLFSTDHFAKEHVQSRSALAAWRAWPVAPLKQKMAVFSDSLEQVDGVSSSLRRFVKRAKDDGREVRIPYCGERPVYAQPDDTTYQPLARTASYGSSLYAGMQFHVPSLMATIDWMWREEITHVELATPGPMGLVGLVVAKLLRLPVTASYHTEVPELLRQLSNSALVHATSRGLLRWFYASVDRVFTFSEGSRTRLTELGVSPGKIEFMPVAIDPDEFSPHHAHEDIYAELGVGRVGGQPIVLSVGRLSREKNLPLIIEAIERLQGTARPPRLVIVGDGPERANLDKLCRDKPFVTLVGLQEGQTLRRLYATADAFVFASRIDTLGLVTMEAMSSGTPVLVPSDAAIADLVQHGHSGFRYEFGVAGLVSALEEALACPDTRARISKEARNVMVERWKTVRFGDVWGAHVAPSTRA